MNASDVTPIGLLMTAVTALGAVIIKLYLELASERKARAEERTQWQAKLDEKENELTAMLKANARDASVFVQKLDELRERLSARPPSS